MQNHHAVRVLKQRKHFSGAGFFTGLLSGALLLLISVSVTALLLQKEIVSIKLANTIVKAAYGAAVLLGSFLTAKQGRRAKLLQALGMGLILMGLAFCPYTVGREEGAPSGMIFWITGCTSLLGGFLGSRERRSVCL